MVTQPSTLLFASIFLVVAGLHDLAARTIPNAIPLGVATLGSLTRIEAHDLSYALIASSIVLALSAFAFNRGLMGGGDVKLLGAVALLVPAARTPALVLTIALAGGVLSLVYVALSKLLPAPAPARPTTLFTRCARAELWRIRRRASLPYGAAIAAGTVLTMFGAAA